MSIVTLELDKDVIALLEEQQHQPIGEAAHDLIIFELYRRSARGRQSLATGAVARKQDRAAPLSGAERKQRKPPFRRRCDRWRYRFSKASICCFSRGRSSLMVFQTISKLTSK